MRSGEATFRSRFVILAAAALLLVLAACRGVAPPVGDRLTVEGAVAVRGAEPFARPVLETDGGLRYVLVFEGPPPPLPARLRVTGTLYRAAWQGRPHAHLRVAAWMPVRR